MSQDWVTLDNFLKWRRKQGVLLLPKSVHTEAAPDGTWEVLAERGTRRSGNQDLIAIIRPPGSGAPQRVESFKSIVDDIFTKSDSHRSYMKEGFTPALVETVALQADPSVVLPPAPSGLPGLPASILLNTLQVIALTEWRKYRSSEPVGGRYLPVRLCAGIAWGVWDPQDITYGVLMQNAVAVLRATTGVREPTLGKVLAASSRLSSFELSRTELEALSL